MKFKSSLLLVFLSVLTACSKPPSYSSMVDNFTHHKPTFSMMASLACDIGLRSGEQQYKITDRTEQERTLLALAETVKVELIQYSNVNDRCVLSMQVWERHNGGGLEKFAYRYNVTEPVPYIEAAHKYPPQISDEVTSQNKFLPIFDMKLAKRWFFSFQYKPAE